MDLTHLHLWLNHVPVIGIGIGFLLLVWGTFRRYEHVQNAGLGTPFITALIALPVYFTGEPAEEVVEHLPGVSEQFIELHEDAALFSLVLAMSAGAFALLALVAKHFSSRIGTLAVYICLLFSIVAGGSLAYTANLGGQIRHSEIRSSQTGGTEAPGKTQKAEHDDDD
jgi:uncharacterized membrane protein